ncbi:MAG: phage protein Gp27 family protein [Syntrophobacter sp.]
MEKAVRKKPGEASEINLPRSNKSGTHKYEGPPLMGGTRKKKRGASGNHVPALTGGDGTRLGRSLAEDLPPDVMEQLDGLLSEGEASGERIGAFLSSRGYDIRKTAIGRYGEDFMQCCLRLRMVEKKSHVLASDDESAMVLEEAASRLFALKILESLFSEEMDVATLAKLLSLFSRLQSSNVQRERLRLEFKRREKKSAEEEPRDGGGGLSDEAADEIRRKILGIPV